MHETSDVVDLEHVSVDQLQEASWKRRLYIKGSYGIGEGGMYIIYSITGLFLSSFLLEVAQIPASYVGIIILLSELANGVSDPIVGKLSDETRTRWGRRRPWIFIAAFPLCFFFLISFYVPPLSNPMKFVYYLTLCIFLKICFASTAVPYTALTPEITMDYDQRTSLTMWRIIVGMTFNLIATAMHGLIITIPEKGNLEETRFLYFCSIAIWAALSLLCILITAITTRSIMPKELMSSSQSLVQLLKESKDALFNKEFISVACIYVFSLVGVHFIQGNIYLWVKYVLKEEQMFSVFLVAIQGTAILTLNWWRILCAKYGKKETCYIGVVLLMLWASGFSIVSQHQTIFGLMFFVIGGAGVGNILLTPWAMLPDVMELDEIKCGYRREGIFYSWFVFFQKIGVGLSLGVSSLCLGWAGFLPPGEASGDQIQPPSVILTLRTMMSLVPIFLFSVAAISVYLFPITRISHSLASSDVLKQRKVKLEKTQENGNGPSECAPQIVVDGVEV